MLERFVDFMVAPKLMRGGGFNQCEDRIIHPRVRGGYIFVVKKIDWKVPSDELVANPKRMFKAQSNDGKIHQQTQADAAGVP